MQDPWEELQGDVERQLTEVEALIERWRITPGGRAAGASEKATLKAALLRSLREIETDLTDMAGVVETCRNDPAKFGLDGAAVARRADFVSSSQAMAARVRDELNPREAQEAAERKGLLESPRAGDIRVLEDGPNAPRPMQSTIELNDVMIHEQQQQQVTAIEQQDEQLGVLSGVMDRLGSMGRAIHDELIAQGRALDEFTAEVDETQGRMRQAMTVMQKMLKNKENGKFCAILVLSVILIVLMFLVFS